MRSINFADAIAFFWKIVAADRMLEFLSSIVRAGFARGECRGHVANETAGGPDVFCSVHPAFRRARRNRRIRRKRAVRSGDEPGSARDRAPQPGGRSQGAGSSNPIAKLEIKATEARRQPGLGTLYVVGMPIGDPADLSPRALAVLSQADLIACEDTRRLAPLLAVHAISTPTLSCFEHNEERRAGARVALVTDAGTPCISDPGFRLVRAALDAGVRVGAIPGPSAVVAALSIAGLPTDRFVFEGLDRKSTRLNS